MLFVKQATKPTTGGQGSQEAELASQVLDLDSLNVRDKHKNKKPEVIEHIKTLHLFCDNKNRMIKISSALKEDEKHIDQVHEKKLGCLCLVRDRHAKFGPTDNHAQVECAPRSKADKVEKKKICTAGD